MESENLTDGGKETQCLNSDIISSLPETMIENILSLIPIRDALRTSVLSKQWRYSWRNMPKLAFKDEMVTSPATKNRLCNAIFHVLSLHNGPTILEFKCLTSYLRLESEFAQMISHLATRNNVKEMIFFSFYRFKLPVSLFSLQGLECIHLRNCTFELPLTFNGFSRLKSMTFWNVAVSSQALERFLSKCPLEHLVLTGHQDRASFVAGGDKFTLVDLLQCVPSIQSLNISNHYMKYLCSGMIMPHKLPTTLVHLKALFLDVCFTEQNEISSALCMIMSSPVLERITFQMCDNEKLSIRQTPVKIVIMDLVKLIMAKSPMLKNVQIKLNKLVSVNEELKMLRDLLQLPFPRASPSAKLTFVNPNSVD